jgi:hypothetical protein
MRHPTIPTKIYDSIKLKIKISSKRINFNNLPSPSEIEEELRTLIIYAVFCLLA